MAKTHIYQGFAAFDAFEKCSQLYQNWFAMFAIMFAIVRGSYVEPVIDLVNIIT